MITEKRILLIEETLETIEMLIESLKSGMASLRSDIKFPITIEMAKKFEEKRLSML